MVCRLSWRCVALRGLMPSRGQSARPAPSHTQNLQAAVVADGYPVWLSRGPLDLVDLPLGCVGQDRVLNGTWHLLDVPDQGLVVVRSGADVAG